MATVINASQNTQPIIRSGGFQRIYPSIVFTCTGAITKWIFAAEDRAGSSLPELQIWRLQASNFIKVGGTLVTPNLTNNINVHEFYPATAIQFVPGDVFGLYVPSDLNNDLSIYFQNPNGPANLLVLATTPASTLSAFSVLAGSYLYPLVTVEITTASPTSTVATISTTSTVATISITSTVVTSTNMVSPTTALPITTTYAILGSLAGLIVALIIFIIILVLAIAYLAKQRKAERKRQLAQFSLRDNALYNTVQDEVLPNNSVYSLATGDTVIGNVNANNDDEYESVDNVVTTYNPSYTDSNTIVVK